MWCAYCVCTYLREKALKVCCKYRDGQTAGGGNNLLNTHRQNGGPITSNGPFTPTGMTNTQY